MIRDSGIYKIKILKEDVKNWNDDEYVFFVKTDDIESAKEIQNLKEKIDILENNKAHIPELAFRNGKAYCKKCGSDLE